MDDEGPVMTQATFLTQLPLHLAVWAAATAANAQHDASFAQDRTFEDWLREILAYEMICRLEEL